MPLFLLFIIFEQSFTQYNDTCIHPSPFAEARLLVSSSLLCSAREEPLWGAEPRLELGPALQQADAVLTKPRRPQTKPSRPLTKPSRTLSDPF